VPRHLQQLLRVCSLTNGVRFTYQRPITHKARDAVKATSFQANSPGQSEVEISGRLGKVTVLVKPVPGDEECRSSKSLTLVRANGDMKAEALIDGPNKESCLHVSVLFASLPQHPPVSPPITAIWVVDKLPSTFWKKGYALRLGPQIDVLVSGP